VLFFTTFPLVTGKTFDRKWYMSSTAFFRFHGALNDFLRPAQKATAITYSFKDLPAIKDAIEAIGVPHVEVDVILVNNKPVDLVYPLQAASVVQVYPFSNDYHWPPGYTLINHDRIEKKFVADVHLGSLARTLRMLGFDTRYQNDYNDTTIVDLAREEQRIVLTRDIGLLKHKVIRHGYWLRSQRVEAQVAEVVRYYRLEGQFQPFERCLACNGAIVPVEKEKIWNQLPPQTILYYNAFFQCLSCSRVYWKGSHYQRMLQLLERIRRGSAGSS